MAANTHTVRRLGDKLLLEVLDQAFGQASQAAGSWCACKVGCTECCHGPFPITALDAWRLCEGLEAVAERDPARAAAIRERAAAAVQVLRPGFPGNAETGSLGSDDAAEGAFCERHAALPCPALDPGSGACQLYEWRPVSCRTYGPPLHFGDQVLPPCRLWFAGAPDDAVEAARVEPDPEDLERDLLEAMDAEGENRETFVAFALGLEHRAEHGVAASGAE